MESLNSIGQRLADRRSRTSTAVVPEVDLRLDDNGCLISEGQALTLSARARAELARRATIPSDFFSRCSNEIQAYLFNHLFPEVIGGLGNDSLVSLVLLDESLVQGIVDPRLVLLHGDEVLEKALTAKPEGIDEDQLEVVDFHLNGDFRISIVSQQIKAEPSVGDHLKAGIDILHNDASLFGTKIESYIYRLACLNGMMVKVCRHASSTLPRIRRAAAGNRELTLRRVEEIARTAWNELEDKMEAVAMMARESVDSSAALIRSIGEKLRFPDSLIRELIDALTADELGPSGTQFDIIASFSRVGTHSSRLSLETRRYLMELSGELIRERLERCPSCGGLRRGKMRYLPRR